MSNAPLPDGWVEEFDPSNQHPFWVDTKANPPRAIWVHPYEDEQFLREHPDVRDRLAKQGKNEDGPPPAYSPRRHSYGGSASGPSRLDVPPDSRGSTSQPHTPRVGQPAQQRGFFGKLKDKAIGTKEEREAEKIAERKRREQMRQQMEMLSEQRRQQRLAQMQAYRQGGFGGGGYGRSGFGGGGCGYGRPMYGPPPGAPFGGGYYGQRRGGGFGGIGLPLIGGLAGGMLLADALDGPDHYGGGYDGGDYGGGDFGGGDFGGGDF